MPSTNTAVAAVLALTLAVSASGAPPPSALRLPLAEYEDRVRAAWLGEIGGTLMGFQFEHKPASVTRVTRIPDRFRQIPVDDDFYYEIVALRGFEKYGLDMTAAQLGRQWKENSAGSWGSSEQARLLLNKGIQAPDTGHPRYNRLWFSIGPQFSAEIYGLIAPGMPNLAARLARQYGHVNGYAEGVDGAVFMAGMVSLAFVEKDPRQIVKQAAQLIHPDSPYRKCLDMVIALAEKGATPEQVANAVEDRWHLEYPATNNAVANGGLVAMAVWFGEGDFLQTVNHAYAAADFTDADCNAANAGTVVGVLRGTAGLPKDMLERLGDRIAGSEMGGVQLTPPVDESVADLSKRTVRLGQKFAERNGGAVSGAVLNIARQDPQPLPAELFDINELVRYWNPEWTLRRAGVGGAGGGMKGLRGNTYLEGDVLATYPRDEVRGLVLQRQWTPAGGSPRLKVDVAADGGRAWGLDVYAGNDRLLSKIVESKGAERQWQTVEIDLTAQAGKPVLVRMIQRVLLGHEYASGNAYWRNLRVE